MSKRKVWQRPASSGYNLAGEPTGTKGLRNKWPSPQICRAHRNARRPFKGWNRPTTAAGWKQRAECMADNFACTANGTVNFRYRREAIRCNQYYLRQMRNAWQQYLRRKEQSRD